MVDKTSSKEEKVQFVMEKLSKVGPTQQEVDNWKSKVESQPHLLDDFVTALNGKGYFYRKGSGEISLVMDFGSGS